MASENGSGPVTWEKFVSYMEDFKRDLNDTFSNRGECRTRHEGIEKELKMYRRLFTGAVLLVVGTFIANLV